jgi:hypothetical protein
MIINLWSTPRTGSLWYSFKLLLQYQKQNPNTILIAEMFNKWHFGIYNKIESGSIKSFQEYEEGSYYEDLILNTDSMIVKEKVFAKRIRNISDEEEYRRNLIATYDAAKCILILRNHVMPLPLGIYDQLFNLASKNIFIGRKQFIQQISSYAVAIATKEFARFKPEPFDTVLENLEVTESTLNDFVQRVLFWNQLIKDECEIVYYEDLNFEIENSNNVLLPLKQNSTSSYDKLSSNTQKIILKLASKYAKSTLVF